MGQHIVKLEKEGHEPRYLIWSTIVDAPVTYGMPLKELKSFYRDEYGRRDFELNFDDRMKRVHEKGTSAHMDRNASETILVNRAGPNETELTHEEIWIKYVDERPDDSDEEE